MEESTSASGVVGQAQVKQDGATKKQGSDDSIPNPFAAEDAVQRLSVSDKTKEFMKDQAFLDKLENLSKDPQNLANHMDDHRVMTALAVLLDVDVTIPDKDPQSMHFSEVESSTAGIQLQQESSSVEPTSTGSPLARSISDKIVKCRELKDEGNKLFKAEDWKKAMKKYHHAFMYVKGITDKLDLLPGLEASLGRQRATEQEKKDATELMLSLLNNLSLCLLKLKDWEKVVNHTSKILTVKENDIKALYRRGTAYIQIGKLEAAESDLKEAQKLNPEDKKIKEQMELLQKKKVKQQEKERKVYAAMFSST